MNGRVPYTIDNDFTEAERLVIAASMNAIEDISCIHWVPRVGLENPSVRITNNQAGCFANVGATTNGTLNLGNNCVVSFDAKKSITGDYSATFFIHFFYSLGR